MRTIASITQEAHNDSVKSDGKPKVTTQEIKLSPRRLSTRTKYGYYTKQRKMFCSNFNLNDVSPTAENIVQFFTNLFNKGRSYCVINSAKSAINSIACLQPYNSISDHPLIRDFTLPIPRYSTRWDFRIVFDYLESIEDNVHLSDKLLSQKCLILLLLLSSQRLSRIFHSTVDRMTLSNISCSFSPVNVLKHSRQGKKLDVFVYNKYPIDKLCLIQCLVEYLKRCNNRVDREQKLFITYGKPFKAELQDSMSRWIKYIFSKLKIFNFSPHSIRAASTSKAKYTGIAIDDIL